VVERAVVEEDEDEDRPSRFALFVLGLRLLFDVLLLVVVLGFIGFIVFVTGLERNQHEPIYAADGITVLTGGRARIDEAMRLLAAGKAKRMLITGVNRTTTKEELKDLCSIALSISIATPATPSTTPPRRANGWRSIATVR
jgi:hypothetical protein